MTTHSSCNDHQGFADELESMSYKFGDIANSITQLYAEACGENKQLKIENQQLIEQMAMLVMFLYSESASYEPDSLGERMCLDFAEPAYELIKPKWLCKRCGNSFEIDGTCTECLSNKLDEYGH